jgi:hypothetical protein
MSPTQEWPGDLAQGRTVSESVNDESAASGRPSPNKYRDATFSEIRTSSIEDATNDRYGDSLGEKYVNTAIQ